MSQKVGRSGPARVRGVVDLEPPPMALHMGRPFPHEPLLQKGADELADVLHIDCGGVRDSLLAHLRGNLRDSLVLREIGEMDQDAFLGRQAHGGTGRNADRVLRVRTYGPAGGRDNLWTHTVSTKPRRRPGPTMGSSRCLEKAPGRTTRHDGRGIRQGAERKANENTTTRRNRSVRPA